MSRTVAYHETFSRRYLKRLCLNNLQQYYLGRGPLSLVSTTEELTETKSSGSGLENSEYGCRDPSH
jgi:hypothetical protein